MHFGLAVASHIIPALVAADLEMQPSHTCGTTFFLRSNSGNDEATAQFPRVAVSFCESAMGIYVEIPIRASIDELWEKTQNPQLHQRWDLRFTQIEYLPRQGDEPQRFLYRTRIGFGLKI